MAKFVNISKVKQVVIGIGEVEPGATIEASDEFNNPNFQKVENVVKSEKEDKKSKK